MARVSHEWYIFEPDHAGQLSFYNRPFAWKCTGTLSIKGLMTDVRYSLLDKCIQPATFRVAFFLVALHYGGRADFRGDGSQHQNYGCLPGSQPLGGDFCHGVQFQGLCSPGTFGAACRVGW
jgi:hypothetical protein